ncbi:hypothetical protein KI688_004941 [Linnemannia hyalina]|uniref:Cyclin-domain-containing protein n=1 Tax=Linnemannia hyalina TaxID=64524 RepID=A0A9P8BR75_9FUNG|nr:hypothetical protein KI688_004941 [Linnemannia hyalina]
MSSQHHHSDSLGLQPQEPAHHHNHNPTSPISPTRAYFPPNKTAPASIPQVLSASLVASLASKKAAYINHPSIQKVIASHTITKQQEANAPDYDETIANIPDLDLLPPPPVYDIVNCSTSQTLLLVSSLINTILAVNDRLACPKITLFHSRAIPNISIEAYLSRILQYAPFQNEVLLIILLYFDRIGGGCKPTQVLTNTIPKSLLRQASLSSEDISQLTAPKTEPSIPGDYFRNADEKAKQGRGGGSGLTTSDADSDILDEEEPIADEIYTSSSESPVGSKLIINSFNIHRLLITSILVACKFSSDVFYPNVRYARVGGLPLSELNQLELEFLFLSQFELNTTESELQTYGNKLLMYHQRLNGTERAAYDAITPAKGEYVRLNEKNQILADIKPAHPSHPPPPPRIQTSDLSQPQQPQPQPQPQHRPSTESEPRPFVSNGPYRDSKEFIVDDDEVMSERADDQVGSPTDWRSAASTPVIKAETPVAAKYPIPRSSKMNLDHMIWPTNEMETKYTPASHYGGMVMDEDAARIEEEFNKASPPPESSEPNPKRKLQRLSSGTMEAVPAKRANTPGKNSNSEKATPNQQGSNKNILKPFLRKIASFAHRSEAAPVQEPEPTPQPPALRSHPYLVRHRISPASSSTNLQESEEVTSPVTPTSRRMSWQQQQQDEYPDQTQGQGHDQMRPPPTFQAKAPPPPYSGQNQMTPYKASASTRGRRQHRSREPSLSSLASELTFEPTRSSLSPMCEEPPRTPGSSAHPATLAPFYFPPRPQSIQGESGHPLSPLRGNRESNVAGEDEEDSAMQCDNNPSFQAEGSRSFQSEPLSASVAAVAAAQGKGRRTTSERIPTDGLNGGSSTSSAPSPTATRQQQHATEHSAPAGRQRIPSHAPSPTTTHPPVQYPHPHYVASYSPAAPTNLQLVQEFKGLSTTTTTAGGAARGQNPPPPVAIPRNPQAILRSPQAILPALSATNSRSIQPQPPALAPRPSRQFAPIRPRTPMMSDEDSKDRVAQLSTETALSSSSSSSSTVSKKKRGSESKSSQPQTPQALRPLVPVVAVANAPPPYRPPFVAYSSPYTPHLHVGPNGTGGTMRPPPQMIMAVDYSHGAAMMAAGGRHGHHPQFIATTGPGGHAGGPRLFIPVIPVMYNRPPSSANLQLAIAPSGGSRAAAAGGGKATTTHAKIAPRLHH